MATEKCNHCSGSGKCSCNECTFKAEISYGEVKCASCEGKGFHWEPSASTFAGPRMPRPMPLRMPGLVRMPKLSRSF